MSLQGTLETIPLPDVLALLAATKKTGELRITGARGDGRVWLDAGRVIGADVPRAGSPVDAIFELLRLTTGSFIFGDGAPPKAGGEPIAVDALLAEAQDRLSAWQAIEAVVPSMACTLRLTPELSFDTVTVSRQQWKELVAVAAGGDVNGAMKHLGIGEFDACRTVKDLVDAGLVQVGKAPAKPAPAPESPRPPAAASPASAARSGEVVETPAPAPALARRPAPAPPAPARAQTPPPAPRPAPVPGRAPAPASPNAAPAAVANSGRSAAPRRGAEPAAADDADELVQQLATLGKAHAKGAPARAGSTSTKRGDATQDQPEATEGDHEVEDGVEGNSDEPINRGMLLKFLSSVRP